MAGSPKAKEIPWYKALIRPDAKLRAILKYGANNASLLHVIFAGYVLVHTTADLLNLGDSYLNGQIMSFAFVLGPFLGLFFALVLGTGLMVTACLLDPEHKSRFQYIEVRPWIPFRILWIRLIGKNAYDKLWDRPGFKHIKIGLSYIYSGFAFIIANISGGKTPLSQLLPGLGWSMLPLLIDAILLGLSFSLFDAAQFSSTGVGMPLVASLLLYLLQGLCWASFLFLLVSLMRISFQLSLGRAALSVILSLVAAILLSWFFFVYSFGIQLIV